MGVRTEFPRRVRRIDNAWIPLSDGVRLAARIWLPEDAEADPVPAILEYLPYRKGDAMARRDARHHPYFAGHGYAAVRVDLRGSGDSDGILPDEYSRQEEDEALEVLAWLAAQPWCTGRCGMFGISWGGFNGLQVAARRPPELRAVISMCASDDRYADDVHYVGGCVLALDMLPWAATMLTLLAQPPDPATVGDGWRETWFQRMERTPAFVEPWLAHQRRDDYWRHGSVCEDYARIEAPVYAIGGWADGYSNAIPRLLAGLPGPRKGLIGPWSHAFPHDAEPGPAIGFLQECLRWWDHWLKDADTGVMDEPVLRAWMQEPVAPAGYHAERPGRWVAEERWPSPEISSTDWILGADGLVPPGAPEAPDAALQHRSPETTGQDAGAWCGDGGAGDWPVDQRAEDGRSLTFTSPPLDERIEVLGFPEVTLALAADRPRALVAVRLCDVAPDGSSVLVTRGLLNLTHRDAHDDPQPLEPGRRYTVTVRLDAIGQAIPAGHRLRVAVSTAYWPWAWPSPEPATLTVFAGADSRLALPVRAPRDADAALAPFGAPEWSAPLEQEVLRSDATTRTLARDLADGAHEIRFQWDVGGHRRLADGGPELDDTNVTTYRIVDGDPLSASVRARCSSTLARDGWHTRNRDRGGVPRDARAGRLRGRRARLRADVDAAVAPRRRMRPASAAGLYAAAMIAGAHTILFAHDAEAARAFFRDVLELDAVDAGGGWLIFALPPGELACHPAEDAEAGRAELYLMCQDVEATRAELEGRGVEFVAPISDEGFGRLTRLRVPGYGELGLYEPRHASPLADFG